MPTAKRLKGGAGKSSSKTKGGSSSGVEPAAPAPAPEPAPVAVAPDAEPDGEFAQVARDHWLKAPKRGAKTVKVQPAVLKRDIWDVLEKEGFPYRSLLALEGLQTLER